MWYLTAFFYYLLSIGLIFYLGSEVTRYTHTSALRLMAPRPPAPSSMEGNPAYACEREQWVNV